MLKMLVFLWDPGITSRTKKWKFKKKKKFFFIVFEEYRRNILCNLHRNRLSLFPFVDRVINGFVKIVESRRI